MTMSLISSVVVTVRYLNDSTSIRIQRRVFIIRGIHKRVERFELVRQLADVFESIPEAAGISVGLLLSLSLSLLRAGDVNEINILYALTLFGAISVPS